MSQHADGPKDTVGSVLQKTPRCTSAPASWKRNGNSTSAIVFSRTSPARTKLTSGAPALDHGKAPAVNRPRTAMQVKEKKKTKTTATAPRLGDDCHPLDNLLFHYDVMLGDGSVYHALQKLKKDDVLFSFRAICERLGLRAIGVKEFAYVLSIILKRKTPVSNCLAVFNYLRCNHHDTMEASRLVFSLSSIFESRYAICLHFCLQMLETKELDAWFVTVSELEKIFKAAEVALLPNTEIVDFSNRVEELRNELYRIEVNYTIFVPEFRRIALSVFPELLPALRGRAWGGISARLVAVEPALQQAEKRASFEATLSSVESADVLKAAADLYHDQLQLEASTISFQAAIEECRKLGRVDTEHPRFKADLYLDMEQYRHPLTQS